MKREDLNIISNIKIIEETKAKILCEIGDIFFLLTKGSKVARESILNSISKAILLLYILGQRLGYSFQDIDSTIENKHLKDIKEKTDYEKESECFSKFESYIRKNR